MTNDANIATRRPHRKRFMGRALVALALTALILGALVSVADLEGLAIVSDLDPTWSLITIAIWLGLMTARTLRFALLSPQVAWWQMFAINSIHNLTLRLMPFRSGEAAYAYLVRRAGAPSLASGVFGLIVVRLLDLVVLLLAFAISSTLHGARLGARAEAGWVGALIVGGLGVLALLRFGDLLEWGARLARWVAQRTGMARRDVVTRVFGKLDDAVDTHHEMRPAQLLAQTSLSALAWGLNFAVVATLMRAMGIDLALAQVVLGTTASSLTALIPAGLGTFGPLEAGWAMGFASLGLDKRLAVASGLVYSGSTFVLSLGLALPCALALALKAPGERAEDDSDEETAQPKQRNAPVDEPT